MIVRSAADHRCSSRHDERTLVLSHTHPWGSTTEEAAGNTGQMGGSAAAALVVLSDVTNRPPVLGPCGNAVSSPHRVRSFKRRIPTEICFDAIQFRLRNRTTNQRRRGGRRRGGRRRGDAPIFVKSGFVR